MSFIKSRENWSCELKDNVIHVYFPSYKKGVYELLKEPYCKKCAYPVPTDECKWHHSDKVDRTYALGIYYSSKDNRNSLLSEHIRGLKRYRNYCVPIGLAMSLGIENIYTELKLVDIIIPIPKHNKELKRDENTHKLYNQSEELAKIIAEECGLRYDANIIVKNKPLSQRGKSYHERTNIDDIYEINNSNIKDMKILLIDDVRTSGGTSSACANLLYNAGADKVFLFVAGRDVTHY